MPGEAHLEAYQGDTWAQTFRFLESGVPVDLTGAAVASTARRITGTTEAELQATIAEPPSSGEVSISSPATGPLAQGAYDYDIELAAGGTIRTWVKGRLVVHRDVTGHVQTHAPPIELELELERQLAIEVAA